jgi:molecular chaperone Hsp33
MQKKPPSKPAKEPVSFTKTDFVQPFLIDHSAIRGRLARMEKTLDKILTAHNYPRCVSLHLAEQAVLASLLSATLAGEGILTVQVKGDGPVRFMVVDIMANGAIRGYARVDEDRKNELTDEALPLDQVLGKGYLAVTLDTGVEAERYQGIVSLDGQSLSDAFRGYFVRSQQAEVSLHVTVRAPEGNLKKKGGKKWAGGGIIIERIPMQGGKESESTPEEQDELWQRTVMFMKTLSDKEMLNPDVTPQNLLYRLFNEDGVWVYKLQPLKAGCRCSLVRVKTALRTIAEDELVSMLDDGKLMIHCEFCNKKTVITEADIKKLYAQPVGHKKT